MKKDNVFINCPFDNEYFPLLKSMLFTLIYLDFNPQISETKDSGKTRLENIKDLMIKSFYSIHDISRIEVKKGGYPRFNMPFECGIDFGIKLSNSNLSSKEILILESEQHRYKEYLSDISGNDIENHSNNPEKIMKSIRDWFRKKNKNIPKHIIIWTAYLDFTTKYDEILKQDKLDPDDISSIPFSEIIDMMKEWILSYKLN